jgi:hypothetical protein
VELLSRWIALKETLFVLMQSEILKVRMKKYCTWLTLTGIMATSSLYANTVTLTEVGGNNDNANSGGAFYAQTTANGDFDTFCLSIVTSFTPDTRYSYTISSKIDADTPPANVPTYVTEGTAYIYNQFLAGNKEYTSDADAVQDAIWYLQGLLVSNPKDPKYGTTSTGYYDPQDSADLETEVNAILDDAEAGSGLSLSALEANGDGAYEIEVMDLNSDGKYAQPQLIKLPEPSTVLAGAFLLLPLGVSAIRILRKLVIKRRYSLCGIN